MTIGEKLYDMRHDRNLTRRQLAEMAGVSPSAIEAAEKGWRNAGPKTYEAIAKALGVTIDELIPADILMPITLDPGAYRPERAHDTDAGYDLRTPKTDMIPRHGSLVIDTGVHIGIPEGYAGVICSKSGLNIKHGIISDGLVDSGYTGSIRVKLYNLSDDSYIFEAGDKISQIMFIPVLSAGLIETDKLEDTERGDGGFGSTGR